MSELLGALQSRVQLRSIDFTVSPAQRRKVEDELIDEALAAFLARADRVRQRLASHGYEIVAFRHFGDEIVRIGSFRR